MTPSVAQQEASMTVQIIRGDARKLPLADASVDLICTSPPYFGLRSYQDGGQHYEGQLGAEATPAEFVDALIECTREWLRVMKPTGSIWVNLGDKYAGAPRGIGIETSKTAYVEGAYPESRRMGIPTKSLIGIPWRYALRCIDDLGLILRAEVIWSKPNGLPESVTDRVRRSHEQWFHFTLNPRYYSAVDEVREAHAESGLARRAYAYAVNDTQRASKNPVLNGEGERPANPLGKLPGSVWVVPTEPLRVPDHLGIDHFAAFPTEFPRRIITGWSPRGVCVECGAGRRPVVETKRQFYRLSKTGSYGAEGRQDVDMAARASGDGRNGGRANTLATITGEACDCPEPTAPTTPGVVLDPFGGTGTTALVADALGRHGISVDMSADYCRLAEWRTTDPKQRAKAARKPFTPAAEQVDGQASLLELIEEAI